MCVKYKRLETKTMSGFDDNPFGEPTIDNPFAVSIFQRKIRTVPIYNDPYVSEIFLIAK